MKQFTSDSCSEAEQLSLLLKETEIEKQQFRPIHYLGSKLRFLEFIESTINDIDPSFGGVCDLFSGSGTVSKFLSNTRPVISVDIQEYSRVICSALLNPARGINRIGSFIEKCKSTKHSNNLFYCIQPMIEYEKDCVKKAISGHPIPLCELIEDGSIIGFELGYCNSCSSSLKEALTNTISRLKVFNFLMGTEALVVRYFGGLYFSYLQAVHIDILLEEISRMCIKDRDTFLAAVLSTTSDIVNTVGKQFAQPIKPRNNDGTPKKNIVNRVQKDRSVDVFSVYKNWLEKYLSQDDPKYNHCVYKMDYSDALDVIKKDIKVVYADPPYTRYHYSRYYHVLETICLRDNPKISKTFINGKVNVSRGIYREDRHQSPFSIKSQSTEAFDTLFKKVSCLDSALVLSYSPYDETKKVTPRVHSISYLEEMARKYFASVEVISVGQFSHSKLNHSSKNFETSYDAERLIVCQK
jgi:adenine-specific DNA methylase